MLKQFHIKLVSHFWEVKTSNKFIGRLSTFLIIITFPLILGAGLVILFFVFLFSSFQKLKARKQQPKSLPRDAEDITPWLIIATSETLKVYGKYAGEIRFGPVYVHLKSTPEIHFLQDKIFGDWSFCYNNCIFLQKWNSLDKPNTHLIAIDVITLEVAVLLQNIPAVQWQMEVKLPNNLQLICNTENETLIYSVQLNNH